jgi:fumarylacetoacetate (FAA) hydrolase
VKLGTLKGNSRDGTLIVVDRHLQRYQVADSVAPNLQTALESWDLALNNLQRLYNELNNDPESGQPLNSRDLAAPLPRAYQWLDGSAYLTHVERVRKARGADMPPSFLNDPLMYQGGSDVFLGPTDPICAATEDWGIDFESEIAVITDDVPMGIKAENAAQHIKLVMLVNDVSLRNLIPAELAKGFGFLHGKPPTSFSPVAVTPDELGEFWHNCKVNLPLTTRLNGDLFGNPNAADDMQFGFDGLIAHAAATRPLRAGTIIGSGTVSNRDLSRGCSCLAEKRVLEIIESGSATTPFMKFGDHVQIEMLDPDGNSIFGAINQDVKSCSN